MICCKNGNKCLEFDEIRGEVSLITYGDRNFICKKIPVFEIALRDSEGTRRIIVASELSLSSASKEENSFLCEYKNDEVTVEIAAEVGDFITWSIKISKIDGYVTEWVNFPQIIVPDDMKDNGGTSKILWGFNEGTLIEDMSVRENAWGYKEPDYPSEGLMGIFPAIVETQFISYYNDDSGLYFASHDINNNLKGIDFCRYIDGIKLWFRHFTGLNFNEEYVLPYPMVMKFFEGDWHDAAQIYRDWFSKNHSEEFVPIKENKKIPSWYGESPVIVTYPVRGWFDTDVMAPNSLFPYCNALEHIERLEKAFGSKIMVILMHWEGTAPWAPPIVWPPYGGEAELKKFTDALHERGDVLGVYCSGLGWSIKSNLVDDYNTIEYFEKNNLREVMCVSPKQELPYSHICPAQRVGYDMCPTQEYTIDIIGDQVEKMTKAGIDYIQLLDQNHGGTSYFCYSKNHNHPPVPGKWQVDAVKSLLEKASKNAKGVLFGCESAAAESYIPNLLFSDNRFELCHNIGRPVPMYSYIYHKYVNNFMGNQVCMHEWFDHKKSPDNLLERLAYSFSAGDMLTVVINPDGKIIFNWGYYDLEDLPEQKSVCELICNLNKWRKGYGKKYLHTGEMIKPYRVKSGKNVIYGPDGREHIFEKVYTCAWCADDSKEGQFLINYNKTKTECEIDLPENAKFKVYTDDDNFYDIYGGRQKIELDRLSAILIEKY